MGNQSIFFPTDHPVYSNIEITPEPFYSIRRAARRLGVSAMTVSRHVRGRIIKCVLVNNDKMIPASEIRRIKFGEEFEYELQAEGDDEFYRCPPRYLRKAMGDLRCGRFRVNPPPKKRKVYQKTNKAGDAESYRVPEIVYTEKYLIFANPNNLELPSNFPARRELFLYRATANSETKMGKIDSMPELEFQKIKKIMLTDGKTGKIFANVNFAKVWDILLWT